MKRLAIIIAAAATVAGCATLKPTQRTTLTSFADYRTYMEEGFLISPSPYMYNFESLGELDIIVKPALVQGKTQAGTSTNTGLTYETITYDELVKSAVDEAKAKGADALVNFSIEAEQIMTVDRMMGGYATGYIYHIKGHCIKRK